MQAPTVRGFRDRDFIRTKEGFFFCIVGAVHPPDRVIAYVKYVPAKRGKWRDKRTSYQRVMQVYTIPSLLETFNLLKDKHPHYLFHSEVYNIEMTAVPHDCIERHYKPEEKLARILNVEQKDILQEKLTALVTLLSEKTGIPTNSFGVTGSILLDIHNTKFSDIDLTIYGLQNSLRLKEVLNKLYEKPDSPVKRFQDAMLADWCEKKTQRYPLSLEDTKRIYERKWNLGLFNNTQFSVHPAKPEWELTEKYGGKTFLPKGEVVVKATVTDNFESLFLPCVYKVSNVKIIEGKQDNVANIAEVVSYESLYDNLAETGEKIIVRGKLERVINHRECTEYYRVLVGSPEGKGKEHIKTAN